MAKNLVTHIYCFDDHRGFSEDVRKRFTDQSRYSVQTFQNREEFIEKFESEKESTFCKIAILGLQNNNEQIEMIDQLTLKVKKIAPKTGLILIGPAGKMDEIKRTIKFNIDCYIPNNSNSILRIHNGVKKLISEHGLGIFRKKRNISVYILLGFILLSICLIIFAYFKTPKYF